MPIPHTPIYVHKQPAKALVIALVGGAIIMFLTFILFAEQSSIRFIVLIPFLLVCVSAWTFSSLTISVDEHSVRWKFGPGTIRGHLDIADIESVGVTRTSMLEGWGIRFTRRGLLYNVAGYDAVYILKHSGRGIRLGTDEPHALVAAINAVRQSNSPS